VSLGEAVRRERQQRRKVSAGGVAHEPDALRIDMEFFGTRAHELDRRLGVLNGRRIAAGLAQAIVDREQRVAVAGKKRPPVSVKRAAAGPPGAAMKGDDDRRLRPALGQIKVTNQSDAIVFGIGNG